MTAMDWGQLAYLGLLGAVLASWYLIQNRRSLGRVAQQAAAWGLIFLGAVAVIGVWDDIRQTVRPSLGMVTAAGRIEVPRARDGHYYLTLDVNGAPVEFLVDTGATDVVLSPRDARRAGIALDDLAYTGRAITANGAVRTAPVRLERMTLGPYEDRNLIAWVNQGEMDQSLLGMDYLQRWSKIEIAGNALVLSR